MHRRLSLLAGTCLAAAAFAQHHAPPDQHRAYEADLLADASARASLLEDKPAPAGGWTKGKFGITDGGANTLNIGGYFQTRYLLNRREDQPDPNDVTQGFQLRRTRLTLSGSIWDKNLTYSIQGDFGRATGAFALTDAFGRYTWDNGVHLRWGQFKMPLLREELTSGSGQLTAERSITNFTFSQQRSQGLELGYTGGQFRAMGALNDGINSQNTDFTAEAADLGVTGRAEFMFAGKDWKRFDDHTSWRGNEFAGMAGAAFHYQTGGETGGATDADLLEATLDVSVEGDGWNAFAAGIWRNMEPAGGPEADDFGFIAQGGVFATEQLEFFARYDVLIPDAGENFNTVTVGGNYYISPKSHAVKFTGDLVYYLDPTTQTPILGGNNTRTNLLADPQGDQVALRLQLQVVF